MRYLIDNKMVVTENGVTTPGLQETEQVLTALPYRLLLFFIAHNHRLMTREQIFQQVWEAHDLIASGPGLATQLSLLRKLLASYGIDDRALTTRPRQGFIFSAEITVLEEGHCTAAPLSHVGPLPSASKRNRVLLAAAAALALAVGGGYLYARAETPTPWYRLGVITGCPVYVADDDMSPQVRDYYLSRAQTFIRSANLACDSRDRLLVSIQQPDISGKNDVYETKQFFSYCRWMKESYLCNSTYFSAATLR